MNSFVTGTIMGILLTLTGGLALAESTVIRIHWTQHDHSVSVAGWQLSGGARTSE